jgi:hypothetical protein
MLTFVCSFSERNFAARFANRFWYFSLVNIHNAKVTISNNTNTKDPNIFKKRFKWRYNLCNNEMKTPKDNSYLSVSFLNFSKIALISLFFI